MTKNNATKADWIKAFGGHVYCPCCDWDAAYPYNKDHKPGCKLVQFNARIKLLRDAS